MAAEMNEVVKALAEKVGYGNQDSETIKDLENRFTYHAPKEGQPEIYKALRDLAKIYANAITAYTPKSREQSLALTNLEQCVFWANASIARQ